MTRRALSVWSLSAAAGAVSALAVLDASAYGLLALAVLAVFAARLGEWKTACIGLLAGFAMAVALLAAAAHAPCPAAGEGQAACIAQANSLLVLPLVVLLAGAAVLSVPRVLSRLR